MSAIKQSITGTGNIVLGAYTLTVGGTSSVSGTNTGDQTSVSGNAGTATALATARNIFNISFDGTANVAGDATNTGHFASIPGTGAAGHFVTENGTTPTLIAGRSAWYSNGSGVPSFKNGTGTAVTLVRSSDLGTGVGTALAFAVGADGAFVVKGGALGTPSSGTLTNCTIPITGITGTVSSTYKRYGASQTLTNGSDVPLAFPTAVRTHASFNGTNFTAPATGYADLSGVFNLVCVPVLGDSYRGNLTAKIRDTTAASDAQFIYDGLEVYFGTDNMAAQSIGTAFPLLASVAVVAGHVYQIFANWDNGGDDATTNCGFAKWQMQTA